MSLAQTRKQLISSSAAFSNMSPTLLFPFFTSCWSAYHYIARNSTKFCALIHWAVNNLVPQCRILTIPLTCLLLPKPWGQSHWQKDRKQNRTKHLEKFLDTLYQTQCTAGPVRTLKIALAFSNTKLNAALRCLNSGSPYSQVRGLTVPVKFPKNWAKIMAFKHERTKVKPSVTQTEF